MFEERILLNTKEAGGLLGISAGAVRVRCCRHELPYRKFGGKLVFIRSELEAWAKGLPGFSVKEALRR